MKLTSLKKIKLHALFGPDSPEPSRPSDVFINDLPVYPKPKPSHARPVEALFSPETRCTREPGLLRSALIFTFIYSEELIQDPLARHVRFVIVSDCRRDTKAAELVVDPATPNLRLLFPRTNFGSACASSFHPKLFILKFDGFLRVVIGSGNLLAADWRRYGNVFWQKDFPLLKDNESLTPNPFSAYLQNYVRWVLGEHYAALVDEFLDMELQSYRILEDSVALVGSLPGRWTPHGPLQPSFCRIQQILKLNPPAAPFELDETRIFYVTSSLGSLNFKLLFDFASAVFPTLHTSLEKIYNNQAKLAELFDVIYPSQKYIAGTYFGESKAKCLFLRRMLYESFKFMRGALKAYKGNSAFQGSNSVIPHYKIFVVAHRNRFDDDTVVYLGSHNFTQSAWGKFERANEAISIVNYELGVLFPPRKGSWTAKQEMLKSFGVQFPADPYTDGDRPFFCNDDD